MNNYRLTPLHDTRASKQRIREKVEQQIVDRTPKRPRIWRPIVAIVTLILIFGISIPVMQQASNEQELAVEKLTFPNVEYSSLIQAKYVEETNELLYEQQSGLYIYDIEQQQTKQVAYSEDAQFFDVQLTKDWLLYSKFTADSDTLLVTNRHTNVSQVLPIKDFGRIQLEGNYVIYLEFDGFENRIIRYNLVTQEKQKLLTVKDYDSLTTYTEQGKVIIFEKTFKDRQYHSTFTVFDIETLQQLGQYKTNFRSINNYQLRGNELFLLYIDQDAQKIGSYNLQTNNFTELKLKGKVDDFVTNGELFAVAVGNAGSSTVEMYRRKGDELIKMKTLDNISERLVRPRLYGNTFLINGETEGNPLYLIESK